MLWKYQEKDELKDKDGEEGTWSIDKAYSSNLSEPLRPLALSPITILSPEFTTRTRKILILVIHVSAKIIL